MEAPLYGLVLAGGKSSRMGHDKGLINYQGEAHRLHIFKLLQAHCKNCFLSIRAEQQEEFDADWPVIVDQNEFRGPFNGLLSAWKMHPEVAWLVLACDLPLIEEKSIHLLINNREVAKRATSLVTEHSGLPEPLAAIWEPEALSEAYTYLQTAKSSCPRKFLLNSSFHAVPVRGDDQLFNANTPEEAAQAHTIKTRNA